MAIGCSALVVFFIAMMMDEPKGQISEVLPDGTVHMIDVG
jgi:NNP family nitrate/nitrite transporter-like MFS transporter